MTRGSKIIMQCSFWLYAIMIWWYFIDQWNYKEDQDPFGFFLHYGLNTTANVLFFYFLYGVLIPHFLFKKKYLLYILLLLASMSFLFCFQSMAWNNLEAYFFLHPRESDIWNLITSIFFYVLASIGFKLFEKWTISEKKRLILLEEVRKTELRFLKSQMSPHFIFNTLNNIYGLSLTSNQYTSRALRELSNIMDYVDQFSQAQKISISKEVAYFKSYIALNKLRYPIEVKFDYESRQSFLKIEPMLLLPFIENAFKHGNTNKDNCITIVLKVTNNHLMFHIKNTIDVQKRKDKVSGVGIQNVKKRLALLYPQQSALQTSIANETYSVKLNLNLV